MKIKYHGLIVVALCLVVLSTGCSVSKNGKRQSLANRMEKRDRQKPKKTEHPPRNKPQKPRSQGALLDFCEDWIGTPYRGGGQTKQGVDCSGFVSIVYKEVYGITLPRRSQDMEQACKTSKDKAGLREGDLVFFNNKQGGTTNHVGIFIDKDRFIHASSSKGVTISRFDEKYWQERFRCGGKYPGRK